MNTIPDRLHFDMQELPNGIKVYSRPYDVPFASMIIAFPFGHMHNKGEVLPGTFHFLEHRVHAKSEAFPAERQFAKKVGLDGGYINALTNINQTRYEMDSSAETFSENAVAMIDHVYSTIFDESDLKRERTVVSNERKRKELYYPGTSELTKYQKTKWYEDTYTSLREIFGSDEDLGKMTAEYLKKAHANYFTRNATVVIGGTFDIAPILDRLSKIETREVSVEGEPGTIEWVKPQFHEISLRSISRHFYDVGFILPETDWETEQTATFLVGFMNNSTHGPIYEWVRHTLGAVYETNGTFATYENRGYLEFSIPLSDMAHFEEVRKNLIPKIKEAVSDRELVEREVHRKRGASLFFYQKLDNILDAALGSLRRRGYIISEEQYIAHIEKLRDPKHLIEFVEKYMVPENMGEMLAKPKTYSKTENLLVNFAKKYILRMN